jgi:hypothetical protein
VKGGVALWLDQLSTAGESNLADTPLMQSTRAGFKLLKANSPRHAGSMIQPISRVEAISRQAVYSRSVLALIPRTGQHRQTGILGEPGIGERELA